MKKTTDSNILVAALCGSIRPGSFTKMALEIALRGAAEIGAETKIIDLNDYELVFCSGKKDVSLYPPDVLRLRSDIKKAQGLIIGTPEYHGSFSGVLKNAIDLMGFDEFSGKMVGLIGVAGGRLGAINALNSLRNIGRTLHAWVIPEQVSISEAWKHFNSDGSIKNNELEARLLETGRQVARFAFLHSSKKASEFVKSWENAPANPGG